MCFAPLTCFMVSNVKSRFSRDCSPILPTAIRAPEWPGIPQGSPRCSSLMVGKKLALTFYISGLATVPNHDQKPCALPILYHLVSAFTNMLKLAGMSSVCHHGNPKSMDPITVTDCHLIKPCSTFPAGWIAAIPLFHARPPLYPIIHQSDNDVSNSKPKTLGWFSISYHITHINIQKQM